MKTKQLLLTLLAVLLPLVSLADVWQDPETKVNYEYTVGVKEASVKARSQFAITGSQAKGDIVILSKFSVDGNEYIVTSIGDEAFMNCGITSINIPNSVKTIGSNCFAYCISLTSVKIPSGLTSIGNEAFKFCTELTSITIPSGVKRIGYNTFQNCYDLNSITISNGVNIIGNGAFSSCSALTSITIPNSVTSIEENAFNGCI